MLKSLLRRIFGTVNDRYLKSFQSIVDTINSIEGNYTKLSDPELKGMTAKFKERVAAGESLDNLLPEAFAVVREAAKRVLGQRHYDVQLIGGIVLHKGMISEMKTGEGKTLVATLPSYLNALTGKGVHVVTSNDYLVKRDAEWMGKVHEFLDLTVGCVVNGSYEEDRRNAYNCDITYATNNELGFDYLRDNMKYSIDHFVQRPFNFAIVDEVDSILIDEARTPLIISGPSDDSSEFYYVADKVVSQLKEGDYDIDEKSKNVTLSDDGINKVELLLRNSKVIQPNASLFDIENVNILHNVTQSLKAHKVFKNNVDYIVKDNHLMIIDEFTGRIMEGRRFSDGLHQALEAKENVPVQNENQTLASVTFQNYFRLYPKLGGMTGTAMTEAGEFNDIYGLKVVSIPTKNPLIRKDEDDLIYGTNDEKYNAIVEEIEKAHEKEQPVLVGTISIEKSEYISDLLKKKRIKHHVLNAKHHEKEAFIIAQAGKPGAVTIATNMAGRGTDIMLGGNAEMFIQELKNDRDIKKLEKDIQKIKEQVEADKAKALQAGGLLVIGTERHESRRIDNQLRGRSGRMGDPGRTLFFLSLEDDLMRIFASQKISSILKTLGLKEGEAIYHPMISKTIAKAQQKVEARNYEIRKNLLRFDDVMNDQRKVIYEQRYEIMTSENVNDVVEEMYTEQNEQIVSEYLPEKTLQEEWDLESFEKHITASYNDSFDVKKWIAKQDNIDNNKVIEFLNKKVAKVLEEKHKQFGDEMYILATKRILLITLDQLWKDHLLSLDHLRHGIYLRAYAQKDPLNEYKKEAFTYFSVMLAKIKEMYLTRITRMQIDTNSNSSLLSKHFEPKKKTHISRVDPAAGDVDEDDDVEFSAADPKTWGKLGRNETCPCGSGKKYKHCHGKLA